LKKDKFENQEIRK